MEDQRIRLTKKLLKTSICDILTKKPIEKVSIKEICEHAGVNRTTFYKYYSSEYDLLNETKKDFAKILTESFENQPHQLALEQLLVTMADRRSEILVFIKNTHNPDGYVDFLNDELIKILIDKKASECGENYKKAVVFIVSGSQALIGKWLSNGCQESPKEMAEILSDLSKVCLKACAN